MSEKTDEVNPRLRLRGESLELAYDPERENHTIDFLNRRIAELKAKASEPSGAGSSVAIESLEAIIAGLRDDVAGLTKMMDTQQAAILLIVANKGSEAGKALELISKATRSILQGRPQLPQTSDVNLSRLVEQQRRREIEEQRDLESFRDVEQANPPKQQGREIGS